MIPVVLGFTVTLFVLGGMIMYKANQRVGTDVQRRRWTKFLVYIVIVHTVILSAAFGYFPWLTGIIVLIGLYEVFSVNLHRGFAKARPLTIMLSLMIYLLLASGLLTFSLTASSETIIFVYLIVAGFDGFSQVTGQLIGKHQLASKISPGKTLEGTFGGLFAAILAALLLRSLLHISPSEAVIVGSLLGAAGLCGDLLASWCKRINGVKDFGCILPGHGGVLDRFDSLFAAGTTFWLCSEYGISSV